MTALRAQSQDFMHNFRFGVTTVDLAGNDRFNPSGTPQAGFSTCTLPELTVEVVEYQTGQDIYPLKFPARPSVSDVTLTRGVMRSGTGFWEWILQIAEGSGNYRATTVITQYHRQEALTRAFPTDPSDGGVTRIPDDAIGIAYFLYNSFPNRNKVAADLDSTSSDISVGEIDVVYESFSAAYLTV